MILFRIINGKKCFSKFILEKIIILFISLFLLNSCDIVVDRNFDDDLTVYKKSNSYSGIIVLSRDSINSTYEFDININSESPFTGSLFNKNDGCVWTFTGYKVGNSVDIIGSITGYYSGSFEGVVEFQNNNTVKLSLEGNDPWGSFTAIGVSQKIRHINLEGNYYAEEYGTITYKFNGETETQQIDGSGKILLELKGNNLTYTIPGIGATRSAIITGNDLVFKGDFVKLSNGARASQNYFTATVKVNDQYDFEFDSYGYAEVEYEGERFVIEGETTGRLIKDFDAIIAILRGGAIDKSNNEELNHIKEWIKSQNPSNNLFINIFSPNKFDVINNKNLEQYYRVIDWLSRYHERTEKIALIGYSAGGHAVSAGDYSSFDELVTRITLDPVDPYYAALNLDFNQRKLVYTSSFPSKRNINLLCSDYSLSFLKLWGYHIDNSIEDTISNTNHFSITTEQKTLDIIDSEVKRILSNNYNANKITGFPQARIKISEGFEGYSIFVNF